MRRGHGTPLVLLVLIAVFIVSSLPLGGPTAGGHQNAPPALVLPTTRGHPHLSATSLPLGVVTTQDPAVEGNVGVWTYIVLPNASLPTGADLQITLSDPINDSVSVDVGLIGTGQVSGTVWNTFYGWTKDGVVVTQVVNTSQDVHKGASVPLTIQEFHGGWWNASYAGELIQGLGGNGTFDLGVSSAEGIVNLSTFGGALSLDVANVGATPFPAFQAFNALGYLISNQTSGVEEAKTGLWFSYGGADWPVAGEDQDRNLSAGEVVEGVGVVPMVTNDSTLWGILGPTLVPLATVTTSWSGSAPNTGIQFYVTVPNTENPTTAYPYAFTAWDPLTPTLSVGVGVWMGLTGAGALPFYAENVSGTVQRWVSDATVLYPGETTNLSAHPGPNSTWDFDEWQPVFGDVPLSGNVSNGSVPAVPRESSGAAPWLEIDAFGAPFSGARNYTFGPSIEVNVSGNWTLVQDGEVGELRGSSGFPVEGTTQDPFLTPGVVVVGPTLPLLPVSTNLWGATNLSVLSVHASPLPPTVGSNQVVRTLLWTNGTEGPVASPIVRLAGSTPPITLTGAPDVVAPGVVEMNFTFPLAEPWVVNYNITIQVVAVGYGPAETWLTTNLTAGPIVVQGRPADGPVMTLTNTTLWLWVNATSGQGPLSGATLTLSSWLGGKVLLLSYSAIKGAYLLLYDPPLISIPSTDTVFVLAHVSGYQNGGGTITFTLEPVLMSVALRATPSPVLSGENTTVSAWVNSTTGAPLAGASFQAALGLTLLTTMTVTEEAAGVYTFPVPTPWLTANTTLKLLVYTTVPGYRSTFTNVSLAIGLRPLEAAVVVGALTAGLYPLKITVTSSGSPLGGATVDFAAPAGEPGSNIGTTNSAGIATMVWTPPAAMAPVTLEFVVTDPGYWTVSRSYRVTTVSSSSGVLGVSPWLLVIVPAAIIAAFLGLVELGRRRSREERDALMARRATLPPSSDEKAPEAAPAEASATASEPPD